MALGQVESRSDVLHDSRQEFLPPLAGQVLLIRFFPIANAVQGLSHIRMKDRHRRTQIRILLSHPRTDFSFEVLVGIGPESNSLGRSHFKNIHPGVQRRKLIAQLADHPEQFCTGINGGADRSERGGRAGIQKVTGHRSAGRSEQNHDHKWYGA